MVKYSVFIPCFNEEHILRKNVKSVLKALSKITSSYELVLVDDGSTDKTPEICDSLSKNRKIKCYHFEGPSRRENLLRAFKLAKGEIIAFMDADLSTGLDALPKLLDLNGYDIAVGSRYLKGSVIRRKKSRLFISYVLNLMVRVFFGSRLRDHYIGFKAFKKDVIMRLLNVTGVGVMGRKMFWDAEMLAWAQKLGYKIKEIPVKWTEGRKSALSFFKELSMIPYIARFFLKFHFSGADEN